MINNNNISPSGDYGVIGTANLTNIDISIGQSISRTFPVVPGCLYHVHIPLFYATRQHSGHGEGVGRSLGRAYGWIILESGTVHYRSVYQCFNKSYGQNNFVDVYLLADSDTLKFTMTCENSMQSYDYIKLLPGSAICVQLV